MEVLGFSLIVLILHHSPCSAFVEGKKFFGFSPFSRLINFGPTRFSIFLQVNLLTELSGVN